MNDAVPRSGTWKIRLAVLALALLALLGAGYFFLRSPAAPLPEITRPPATTEATSEQVHQFCGVCHAYPPADTFPRSVWRREVKQGYDFFFKNPRLRLEFPSLESVALYYEKRAPETLPALSRIATATTAPVLFERRGFRLPEPPAPPGITHVNLVHLFNNRQLDVLVCDALRDQVLVLKPSEPSPTWQVLIQGSCCAHAEVVDLDGDGLQDVVLACLGNFYATDDKVGSVVWLRGKADGTFTPLPLLDGVGRVADVQAADFTGDGKRDLVVAVFGWREHGEILVLENRTTDWSQPVFVPHVVDSRHGTIHVPVTDLNQDGRPDFVALISQEHETVVAFLNEGNGRFRAETIYAAPHPAFGSTGIQLVDLDGDGDRDVLFTNGDALDAPYLLKPYHGVQWLENRSTFPFVPHRLVDLYGAARAGAADLDGDGDLDLVVVSYLPDEYFPQRAEQKLESVLLLEQTGRGQFVPHVLEAITCDHLSCALGDVDGDGKIDLVTGNFAKTQRQAETVVIWKNLLGK